MRTKKWTERCAGCGGEMELTRGPHGVEPLVAFIGKKVLHLACVRTYTARTYTACADTKSERFMMRLSIEDRADLNRLQDETGAKSVADVVRKLCRDELVRLERLERAGVAKTRKAASPAARKVGR